MWDENVQARLNEGTAQGEKIKRELMELGYRVVRAEETVEVRGKGNTLLSRGRIDFMFDWKRTNSERSQAVPCEVKSMNPNVYKTINEYRDFTKKPYLRKYIRQMQMYLYGTGKEYGLFLITDCLGGWKLIPVYLDYEECEMILKRLEKIHEYIAKKELPERISYSEEICGRCNFVHVCLPDIVNEGIEIIDKPEFTAKLERRNELLPLSKEFDELDGEVKDTAKMYGKDLIVGDFQIIIRKGKMTKYDVPQEVKLPFKTEIETCTVKIINNKKSV
jgi:CRISPR/Cas system-associated exonuclease Cas4 (RecB family)